MAVDPPLRRRGIASALLESMIESAGAEEPFTLEVRPSNTGAIALAFGLTIAHEVYRGDRRIDLTKTEFLLLEMFMRLPRQVLTRSMIFEHVWGYDFGPTSNALGVYMGYLRRKTEAGDEPRLLHTVRGVGYILKEP